VLLILTAIDYTKPLTSTLRVNVHIMSIPPTITPLNTPLNIAILTISDTRTLENDTSGDLLANCATESQHTLTARALVKDDIYLIRSQASQWIADPSVHVIISTGGTGFSGRDSTPEALIPLFDKTIDGFGELFRQVSYDEIGSSTIQSRCVGGLANSTLIFCLPGSNNACKTGWDKILKEQLDSQHKPCNYVGLLTKNA
jgi:molybdenum cofactor biosynthesis protein B